MKRLHLIICGTAVALLMAAVALSWAVGWIDFFSPIWLTALLLLPFFFLVAVKGIAGLPSRTNAISLFVRCLLFLLIVLCLADIQIVRENENICVLYLLDHSASIPDEIAQQELAYVNASASKKGRKDTAGIVVFGASASVEVMPAQALNVDRVYSYVGKDHTDLQRAIELATAAFPADVRKKIVLITDGNENSGSILEGIEFAAANRAIVDILPVTYAYEKEVLIEKVYLPDTIKENETFDLRVHVLSHQRCPADLSIYRNGVCMAREHLALKAGRNTFAVAMKIEEPGFYTYTARLSAESDTVRENNTASGYVYIQGASRILLVAPTELEVGALARACREENIEVDMMIPEDLPNSLGMLQNHDCVVLANVAADELSADQMAMLQANVRDLGVGLVMIGGENSFGAGGYEGTPIEAALPVTMDIKQRKINPKGALVLVLHTCEFADGNYWAKQISKKAIQTVNRQDEVGVLLYSGGERWLFKLRPAADKAFMYSRIDGAAPGDMPSFGPTLQLAHDALVACDAMVKHVIVISDGDPARPTPALIKAMADAGITISTVAINPHSPRDVDVLKYLAYATKGRYYFADDPSVLPRIFVKEAKVVKRSLIFNKKFQPLLVLSTELTKGIRPDEVPPLLAYVATTPKGRALVPLVSDNENQDPVLAYWRYGLGKAVAFTSDATSNWGKHWVAWPKYKKFWTQILRWAARKREKSVLRMHTTIEGSRGKLTIDAVDRRGRYLNFLKLTGRLVGPDNKGAALDVRQTAPGRYEADFDAGQVGVSILNVGYRNLQTGGQGFAATGVSVPYSPEYQSPRSNLALIQRAAAAGGGKVLTGDPGKDRVFSSHVPATRSFRPIWASLLALALFVFFADVILRRVIVTRDDIRSTMAAVRVRLARRGRPGERDKTMAALLHRKAKTFERVSEPAPTAAEGSSDFKSRLDKAASGTAGESPAVTAGQPPDAVEPERAGVSKEALHKGDRGQKQDEPREESYTSRLLAAKRRAQDKGGKT